MTDYFSEQYRTYRLLLPEQMNRRGEYQRKVARLMQAYPSAIQFAEQLSAIPVVEKRTALHYKAEKVKVRQVWSVVFTYQSKAVGSVHVPSFTTAVSSLEFSGITAETDQGARTVINPTVLQRHDEVGTPMHLGYKSTYGSDMNALEKFLPWCEWTKNQRMPTMTLNMLFRDMDDANAYAARILLIGRKLENFDIYGLIEYEDGLGR